MRHKAGKENETQTKHTGRNIVIAVVVVLAAFCAYAAALVHSAMVIKDEVTQSVGVVRDSGIGAALAGSGQDSSMAGMTAIEAVAPQLQQHTTVARGQADGWVWRSASMLPVIGNDFAATRIATDALDTLASDVLPSLTDAANTMQKEQLKSLSAQDRKELLKQLQQEEKESKRNRRDAYEGLRAQFMLEVKNRLLPVVDDVKAFRDWVEKEAAAFRAVMREYGQLRKDEQASFTIVDGDMKLEVRSNKVKSFDERADLAAERLVDYLKRYAMGRELGTDDPMYQLGMTMIERNRQGDLDYKSVSKLYELEDRFDSEYTEIMDLFRESNVVYKTAVNYYFHKRDENGVWHRIEPSFCRL